MERYRITSRGSALGVAARADAVAQAAGIVGVRATEFAITVLELATNQVKYAGGGVIELIADEHFVFARAIDRGPGLNANAPPTVLAVATASSPSSPLAPDAPRENSGESRGGGGESSTAEVGQLPAVLPPNSPAHSRAAGLGVGLEAVQRLSDVFDVVSTPAGTTITVGVSRVCPGRRHSGSSPILPAFEAKKALEKLRGD